LVNREKISQYETDISIDSAILSQSHIFGPCIFGNGKLNPITEYETVVVVIIIITITATTIIMIM